MPEICNVCGSNRNVYFFTRTDKDFGRQDVYQCKDCGLVFIDSIPELNALKSHYNDYFFTEKFNYVESGIIWERFYELNLEYIERIKKKGRLLEVGCGLGHFLNVAQRRGWETYGVELSEFASNYASNNFKLKIYNRLLKEAKFSNNQFDVVILWATLEHMIDPIETLVEIHRILMPEGLLALSVPNHNNFFTQLYGMRNTDMQHCEHIYHFPFRTMKIMLNKAGFTELRRMVVFGGGPKGSWIEDIIQFIARKLNIGSELRVVAFKK